MFNLKLVLLANTVLAVLRFAIAFALVCGQTLGNPVDGGCLQKMGHQMSF
jgi:hypothetical protein